MSLHQRAFILVLLIGYGFMCPEPAPAQPNDTAYAFIGVSIVPMNTERVIRNQVVLVQHGSIAAIGSASEVELPAEVRRIDATGQYLMPGLADMHVHIFSEKELPLYLANGVTTVRNMWGWDMHLKLRDEIASGDRLGPTIITAGSIIDGVPPRLQGSAGVQTAIEAEREVVRQAQAGFDFIKVYDDLTPKAYSAIVLTARALNLPVAGHAPDAVGLRGALVAGQRSIEHLQGYAAAATDSTLSPWSAQLDPNRLARLAEATRDANVWNTPTLIVLERADMSAEESENFLKRKELEYLPSFYRRFCCGSAYDPEDDFPDSIRAMRTANRFRVVQALHQAGARLLLGSDTGNRFVLPGFSLHAELQLLTEAGLTPYEALRAGTLDAASFLGRLADFGTIEVGKRADLILVHDNPLSNLATIRSPVGVMVRGHWLPRQQIDDMLQMAESHGKKTSQ